METRQPSRLAPVRGLALACHPVPTVGVTVLATVLAVVTDQAAARVGLVAAAVLAGQLSIGWSNDAIDADRDATAHRSDKPVAQRAISRRAVAVAGLAGLVATVGLSLVLGLLAGSVHLLFVACGWAYNLGLKRTALSWLPYAMGFAALPCFVVLAAPGQPTPPWWLAVAGGLLGVGAHLVNVLPDLADDLATGVRGWPHRLGPRRAVVAAAVLLALASAVLVIAPPGPRSAGTWVGLVAATGAAGGVVWLGLRRPAAGRALMLTVLVIALIDIGLVVVSTDRIA